MPPRDEKVSVVKDGIHLSQVHHQINPADLIRANRPPGMRQ